MKFAEITERVKVFPGEYIFHKPTNQVVLCGSFNRAENWVRVLAAGKMFTDKIDNFRKIVLKNKERKELKKSTGCSRCKKKK